MINPTKPREFIKEGKSPGPDGDRDRVCGQSEGHLSSVGQIASTKVGEFGTLVVEKCSGSCYKPRWKRMVVEFLKYRTFSFR